MNMKILLLVLLVIIGIIAFPFVIIWSLNTLFGLSLAYGFFEWLAAFFLIAVFKDTGLKVTSK